MGTDFHVLIGTKAHPHRFVRAMPRTNPLRKAGKTVTAAEARAVRAVAPRTGREEKLIETVGKLGDQPELRAISAAVVAAGMLTANRRLVRAGVRMLLAHEIATMAKDVIKRRIDRTRPRSASSHSERKVKPGRDTAKEETSFPSGHSAGSIAVARAFAREYPDLRLPALAAAGLVGAAQVPRLAHYPSDVAAGMVLGIVSEAAADMVMRIGERLEETAKP